MCCGKNKFLGLFFKKSEDSKLQKYWNKTIYIYKYIYIFIYIYNYAIEKYNRKKGIHDYSFSTIEISQTIKCIAKNELKNSYVNQTIRRFWAKKLLKQNRIMWLHNGEI